MLKKQKQSKKVKGGFLTDAIVPFTLVAINNWFGKRSVKNNKVISKKRTKSKTLKNKK